MTSENSEGMSSFDNTEEGSVFDRLRATPPRSYGSSRQLLEAWNDALDAAEEYVVAALGEAFNSCPYDDPVAGLTAPAVWELAVVNVGSRLGLHFLDEHEELD